MSGAAGAYRPRAILYDRVSTVIQAKGGYSGGKEGFQLEKCRAWADIRDWQVVGQITDVDSGAEWEIAGILEAVDRAKAREYDKLVVFETSRFARSVGKKAVYETELKRHGVDVVYLNLPEGEGAESQLMSDMMGALDAYERERIRRRVMHGIQQKAKRGQVIGNGAAPYGYQYVTAWNTGKHKQVPVGLEAHPERTAIVERIVSAAATSSLAEIAAGLTGDGIPTPTGRSAVWNAQTLALIVKSRIYIGEWSYGGITVAVPPIVDRAVWNEAQLRLGERRVARRGRRADHDDEYLLRGMLTCGHCGGLLCTWKQSRWTDAPGGPRPTTTAYLCLRHKPARAAKAGVEVCPLPMLPASVPGDSLDTTRRLGIEDAAQQWVDSQILDPGALSRLVKRIDELHGEAGRARDRQIADLDSEIRRYETREARAIEEQLDVERGSTKYTILKDAELRAREMLGPLRADRATLVGLPVPGMSAASLERLQGVIRTYVMKMGDPTPETLRRLYRDIRLRGTVMKDAGGPFQIGHYRYRLAWSALIEGDSDQSSSERWSLFSQDGLTLSSITPTR